MTDKTITIEKLQILARAGDLRVRAFGETNVFGAARPYSGNFEQAAADLPDMLGSGLAKLYEDDDGLFIGPVNPTFVERDLPQDGGRS